MAQEVPVADPRPLPGEPLALDLLNTRWNGGGNPRDLLGSLDELALWLELNGFADRVEADRPMQEALRSTREAIVELLAVRGVGAEPHWGPERARTALNEVLAHGCVRRELGPDGPVDRIETDLPAWLPAWTAAEGVLRLLAEAPDRIRSCASPDCVLYFLDTSKNGTRRWHAMASCGNRAKASRHYARGKNG
ncbi:CGNR zinc finger domain-containing protein [Kitasatospora nipponensis]|uniref:CGNR zinc finger domain-containing protein n=1 Tax=Kitasatospora nipponensis TaxID=258049 RepID=A0ABN1VXM2_9ACTN